MKVKKHAITKGKSLILGTTHMHDHHTANIHKNAHGTEHRKSIIFQAGEDAQRVNMLDVTDNYPYREVGD